MKETTIKEETYNQTEIALQKELIIMESVLNGVNYETATQGIIGKIRSVISEATNRAAKGKIRVEIQLDGPKMY